MLGGANLRPGRQRAEEDLLTAGADPPPSAIKLDPRPALLQGPPQAASHWSAPRSPNSSYPSAPFPTPSRSPPPATLTRAGTFAYLHMQTITFAYGAPQGGLRVSRFAVCRAPSHSVPVAKGWGGGRAGGVRPPGLALLVPRGLEEVLPWRRHAPHPLPGPGSPARCLRFSPSVPPHPAFSRPVPRSPTEILHRPLAA